MIIELLPGHDESDIEYLESLKLEPISSVLAKDPDLHHYLFELFPDAMILEERTAEYRCDCSRERFMRNLLTLPKKDLEELSEEDHLEIHCEFCNKNYRFSKDDIRTVMSYVPYKR
jgi:molecular chaperone Hsp33